MGDERSIIQELGWCVSVRKFGYFDNGVFDEYLQDSNWACFARLARP